MVSCPLKNRINVNFNDTLPAGVGEVIKGWDIGVDGI
jgi:FKBP-type peptidyl-prolyl cis-trans isomerase